MLLRDKEKFNELHDNLDKNKLQYAIQNYQY